MFKNRRAAGQLLAKRIKDNLSEFDLQNTVVFGIPRGGVVTAAEVARGLGAQLSIVVTKKIGAPGHEELAVGAVSEDGSKVLDHDLIARLRVKKIDLEKQIATAKAKIQDYKLKFKTKKLEIKNKTVILVDDGIATGSTVESAVLYLKKKKPKKLVVASPVSSRESYRSIGKMVDEMVVLDTPSAFYAVGQFYRDFPQVTDEEVVELIQE
ncbi:hypothetical protein A3D84_04535 [Candidatus Woesebacteria bacterium RIFCSPHIGHO2_02_FULL_42_20]|uniref:Phosphoribosyltransferase domain-containing protein n=1 Tax=Candidatus Woesebacteria bacterium RIFCSPHIGHO2_12_FULL_41_24 TaxID=1802510 RepID=A0A1F8AS47_9BACT|nr:MAG: hypothetical protein A2W15_06360 [Candidatus Woesebacteria bacterium RBG_16_41_13]OGM28664.1 MAG: hypothetical protein A2873_05605 [Candidatus Woesebacteria bacterium RIFCSPHIGHO2_01_FULL_42_80]OGM34450.1 MAG: hypothetical protein A3D84_04535 [Candidatus Woesebacteria bacterium RIFCSPHIGHO2_02_FULL_42_20]OGM54088.1 MAG: hypothetical protein A3E44_02690 [Candidatus Woesebacteria bacterium RIFCSPHIGHO2_12_FULL_41_24]OGM66257.1 MAG: hypothetical protein A2969_01560 [Candidatus Woesebacteri